MAGTFSDDRWRDRHSSEESRRTVLLSLVEGDHLGELRGDFFHRIFCSTQAASRGEQRADVAESFIRGIVYKGDKLLAL